MRKTLLVLALVLFGVLSFAFKDVPEDHWAYEYIMDLANRGILPMEDNFNPDVVLTKAEIAVLLSDTLTYVENDPVLAKAEDIKRVETVMKMFEQKLASVESKAMEDNKALSVKLGAVESAVTANQNVLISLTKKVNALENDLSTLKANSSRNYLELKYTVLDLSDKLNSLPKLKDDVSVNIENIDGLWEELDTVKSDLDYVAGQNAKEHNEIKALIAKKADAAAVDNLSKDLKKANDELATLKKVAYKAYNNADMVSEDMLDLQDQLDNLSSQLSNVPGDLLKVQYLANDLSDRVTNVEGKVAANEEKVNKANMLAIMGIALAGVAMVIPFVVK
ncbi:S-layer homology domain-containing protein [Marinitoga aeolica]|uniref:S-layer homology domain-containing protein n=1 Tax=Marinitoga aeolica TaxID=2809031 RepID=A0ABY8PNN9_9BACT|nr:S-layer homology domain-containing protein [Marinitoga aeolica]WGS64148.1 S-layer homology domain-containing protein [Marinitoga aeolica]